MWNLSDQKVFWILMIVATGLIVINGITTDISLGDESHHYRFAQNIYQAGKRVAFDPIYESGNRPGFFYNDPPLWHLFLASLWKIGGGTSQAIAQMFHVLFFVLLVWVTSLLARESMGEREKWFPALVIATVPMVVSFSTLLYMDVPMTALSTLSFYLILKGRYLGAGVASGLAFFTKLNAAFFFPGFLFLILWKERKRFWRVLRIAAFFTVLILLIYIPDRLWRTEHLSSMIDHMNVNVVLNRLIYEKSVLGPGSVGKTKEYFNSYLTNPIDIVKYLGLPLLLLILFYLLYLKRPERKRSFFWIPIISYLLIFLPLLGVRTDIRYLLPILPFLIVLVGPSYLLLGKTWRFIILGLCLLQFVSTTFYVHQKRQISLEVKQGFEYVRQNVSRDALILYPEENFLIYGQRRIIWSAIKNSRPGQLELYSLLWTEDREEMDELLRHNKINYVLIKKSRIHDNVKEHHTGGYPRSFVERLSQLNGWAKVFENGGVVLWKRGNP
jgi:4-amino-4-deoxy-L-arabinose transferase-like glycosyltransferase